MKVSDEEITMCIFDGENPCNVRKELQEKNDVSDLMDKVLTPDSSPMNMGPLGPIMEKMGRAFSDDLSVLPRFCDLCLKHSLRKVKH